MEEDALNMKKAWMKVSGEKSLTLPSTLTGTRPNGRGGSRPDKT
jgi:hypothetical protein